MRFLILFGFGTEKSEQVDDFLDFQSLWAAAGHGSRGVITKKNRLVIFPPPAFPGVGSTIDRPKIFFGGGEWSMA